MSGMFLENLVLNYSASDGTGAMTALLGLILGALVFFLIVAIGVYIYTSLAFMALAKKTKVKPAGIAWIPYIGPALIASKISRMHWWPLLLILACWIPFIGMIAGIVLVVYLFIWMWKTFEAVGKPGWWVLLALIPFVGWVVYLVLLGVAAWGGKK